MAKIPFPTTNEMVEMGIGLESDWTDGFSFPEGYVRELKERFPDVQGLHRALDSADEGLVNSLLSAYLTKLTVITPEQVVKTAQDQKIDELVDRARQAIEFRTFLSDLEKCHFPERIKAREEFNRQALESWM